MKRHGFTAVYMFRVVCESIFLNPTQYGFKQTLPRFAFFWHSLMMNTNNSRTELTGIGDVQYLRHVLRCVLCKQFRKLVCQCLATLLCVKCGHCSLGDPNDQNTVEIDAVELDPPPYCAANRQPRRPSAPMPPSAAESDADGQVVSGIEHLLSDIRDLLEITVRSSARQRQEEEKNQKMMNDWMVAAAVIDRICFILIAMFFIGGTAAFVVLRYLPHNSF